MHRQTKVIVVSIQLGRMACPADKLIHRLEFQVASLEEIVETNRRHVEETILIDAITIEEIITGSRLQTIQHEITSLYVTT